MEKSDAMLIVKSLSFVIFQVFLIVGAILISRISANYPSSEFWLSIMGIGFIFGAAIFFIIYEKIKWDPEK